MIVLVAAVGCSGKVEPTAEVRHDSEQAKQTLIAALDAWKSGKAQSLSRRNPPIRFEDEDFTAGFRLADFELEEPDAPVPAYSDVPVILSLRDRRGKSVRRETRYQVTTAPGLAVLRSDH
jgi:hypothetical protein